LRRAVTFIAIRDTFLGHTPQSIKYRLGMELRSQAKVNGSQARPRATPEGRIQLGTDHFNQPITTFVNSPSSATGVTRDGKKTSRLLPAEGGQFRAVAPQPRSESVGGADTSPEGDPSRRRWPCRESGDRDGGPASNREPELAADMSGEPLPPSDEGNPGFTCFMFYVLFYFLFVLCFVLFLVLFHTCGQ